MEPFPTTTAQDPTMSFNPANFPWTMPLNAPAQARQDRATAPAESDAQAMVRKLEAAAARWALRRDSFAIGKADACLDIAAKLDRFGSFASDKQREYADKLVAWSLPRQQQPQEDMVPQADRPQAPMLTPVPRLHTLMQRLAKLEIGSLRIVRKNGDSLCWIKHEAAEKVVGRIVDGGLLTLWARPGVEVRDVLTALVAIERDPEAAAVLHGRASGRCAVCSRDLTDPESIARGIGPVCAERF